MRINKKQTNKTKKLTGCEEVPKRQMETQNAYGDRVRERLSHAREAYYLINALKARWVVFPPARLTDRTGIFQLWRVLATNTPVNTQLQFG